MRKALLRLANAYVYADGRSVRALIKRGLAHGYGSVKNDGLLGSFNIVCLTPLGREVAATLSETTAREVE